MKLSDFNYNLPPELIALQPVLPKDTAKMLVLDHNSSIKDRYINSLVDFLNSGDLIIFNNTKVIPAKLTGYKIDSKFIININLHKHIKDSLWSAFAKPTKKLDVGECLLIGNQIVKIMDKLLDGQIIFDFGMGKRTFEEFINQYGQTPLPSYIEKRYSTSKLDKSFYQTMFAKYSGSVAAPTAGLHFTPELMSTLSAKGINHAFITLHVGGGTFLPVKTDNIYEHKMHSEFATLCPYTADLINLTKKNGKRIITVGTTSTRVLEAAADSNGLVKSFSSEVDLFIVPGYKFKVIDMVLTNFHLPKSTLLMLVAAFTGYNEIFTAYNHAIKYGYRFYSYGDCCLLYNKGST